MVRPAGTAYGVSPVPREWIRWIAILFSYDDDVFSIDASSHVENHCLRLIVSEPGWEIVCELLLARVSFGMLFLGKISFGMLFLGRISFGMLFLGKISFGTLL